MCFDGCNEGITSLVLQIVGIGIGHRDRNFKMIFEIKKFCSHQFVRDNFSTTLTDPKGLM